MSNTKLCLQKQIAVVKPYFMVVSLDGPVEESKRGPRLDQDK